MPSQQRKTFKKSSIRRAILKKERNKKQKEKKQCLVNELTPAEKSDGATTVEELKNALVQLQKKYDKDVASSKAIGCAHESSHSEWREKDVALGTDVVKDPVEAATDQLDITTKYVVSSIDEYGRLE